MAEFTPWVLSPATDRDRLNLDWMTSGAEPVQEPRSADPWAAYKTLARAILCDAFNHRVHCTRRGKAETCRQCQRDMRWLTSNGEKYIFSFANICEMLHIGVAQTRERFLREVAVYARDEQVLRFHVHLRGTPVLSRAA